MSKQTGKKVFVGVSGGVDSSVSLALLKDQGYDVVGVFIRTWQPDWTLCTWRDERRDAMRVCAHLDVPFIELDLEKEYKEGVVDYMIREYRAGRTPNPDVMCNREVKFGLARSDESSAKGGFLKWALDHGADYVATGHYVDRTLNGDGTVTMLRGNDAQKDQSYFLWTLEQEQLQHILFPVGSMSKADVRKLAKKYQLPTATKKDSQGICFIGDIDMKEFLAHYIDETPGDVLATDGNTIGSHKGALFYTIGERHGFMIDESHKGTDDQPRYVVAKDLKNNTITVSDNPLVEGNADQKIQLISIVDNQGILSSGCELHIQVRYRGKVRSAVLDTYDRTAGTGTLCLDEADPTIAAGQSIVFYDGTICLGGGIVD